MTGWSAPTGPAITFPAPTVRLRADQITPGSTFAPCEGELAGRRVLGVRGVFGDHVAFTLSGGARVTVPECWTFSVQKG